MRDLVENRTDFLAFGEEGKLFFTLRPAGLA